MFLPSLAAWADSKVTPITGRSWQADRLVPAGMANRSWQAGQAGPGRRGKQVLAGRASRSLQTGQAGRANRSQQTEEAGPGRRGQADPSSLHGQVVAGGN